MPEPLPNSIKSNEPADLEEPTRVGFYTDMSREEVINYYKGQFEKSPFLSITPPMSRLNYPPEEAKVLIRDQTQSTFLEELVYPTRESLFINGYRPRDDKTPLIVDGRKWGQKIIIKYVSSSVVVRFVIGLFTMIFVYIVLFEWKMAVDRVFEVLKK